MMWRRVCEDETYMGMEMEMLLEAYTVHHYCLGFSSGRDGADRGVYALGDYILAWKTS